MKLIKCLSVFLACVLVTGCAELVSTTNSESNSEQLFKDMSAVSDTSLADIVFNEESLSAYYNDDEVLATLSASVSDIYEYASDSEAFDMIITYANGIKDITTFVYKDDSYDGSVFTISFPKGYTYSNETYNTKKVCYTKVDSRTLKSEYMTADALGQSSDTMIQGIEASHSFYSMMLGLMVSEGSESESATTTVVASSSVATTSTSREPDEWATLPEISDLGPIETFEGDLDSFFH